MFSRLLGLGKQDKFIDSANNPQRGVKANQRNKANNSYNTLDDLYSARKTLTSNQHKTLLVICALLIFSSIVFPFATVFLTGLIFVLFYLCVVLFRAAILCDFDSAPNTTSFSLATAPYPLKKYSILVALYKEAGQVEDLVASLSQLKWNADKIEIFLLCEEIDLETISAIKQLHLPKFMHLVVCPKGQPQTKPRALNYALQYCTGDYLVIYDAEDRPHPDQLLEAHFTFQTNLDDVACLQAPLLIDNCNETWLTKMFAIEYTTLFSGILRSLANWGAPMPLGGTSNHFKTKVLKMAGGWDAYNVTEDADLGIRLARLGYRCGVINCPTYEEAPTTLSAWLPQRTRWLKGWIQTLLVHLRSPKQLFIDLGWRNFICFHLLITGIVISVMIHPFFIIAFPLQVYSFLIDTPPLSYQTFITGISTFTLIAGYLTYGFLALAVTKNKPFTPNRLWLLSIPIYWLLISMAGWRAVFQIFSAPHKWEKTEHGKSNRDTPKI